MSKAPSMPVFTDALIGDTTHLSMEEFGAYCMILFVTWRNNGQPLPDDAKRMARICRVPEKRWTDKIRPVVAEFFDLSEGTWRQARLEKEWDYVAQTSAKNSENAKARWGAKSLKNNETDNATASDPHVREEPSGICPHTQTQEKEDSVEADASTVVGKPAPSATDADVSLLPTGKPSVRQNAARMAEIWNQTFADRLLPTVRGAEGVREKRLAKLLRTEFREDFEEWRAFCQRVRGSPQLTGENRRGWKAGLDWCLEPQNFTKIIEGNYDPQPAYGPVEHRAQSGAGPGRNPHGALFAGFAAAARRAAH